MIFRHVTVKWKCFGVKNLTVKLYSTNIFVKNLQNKLESAKIEDVDFNIRCIFARVLNKKVNQVQDVTQINLNDEQIKQVERMCECRIARMPLQYILGEWDFGDLTLKLTPPVFIPRPETEGLVQLIINKENTNEPKKFLEIGCGSGAICLSLLHGCRHWNCIVVDSSKIACGLTLSNAKSLNMHDRIDVRHHKVQEHSLLPENLNGQFDFIVSNPPYVKTEDLQNLESEVLYENISALDGGDDGLTLARVICQLAVSHLKPGGTLWMELDSSHPPVIQNEIENEFNGRLKYINNYNDIFQKPRFVKIVKQ